ncbi:16S rRNA (uracil(1498)-N(3))-methyltransferase [Methyloradius palustris]|uniref:Ribosomal RNA small subunit methyltransferase E n=1 Tax=Methyloradius palustris TaxID=2778876 RepID=A0A8D5GA65_9PROT|nr:16S rRNA (uracil(1498)-N(3))-methyltransferase [Methyloradius palustris]BCM25866.1 ribosomal RNA small subunit methyltransferase E [Methyloradius palustris]
MATPRFYCPKKFSTGSNLELPENAATHAARVLRMQAGDKAILFNGDGFDYLAELTSVSKSQVGVKIISSQLISNESPLKITLLQGISAGDRMDFTIQKAVEMGVSSIQPISTQRSVVKLSAERAEKRIEHWQNVMISACEQSGRAIVPEIAAPVSLAQWFSKKPSFDLGITLAPSATQSLKELSKPTGNICLLIGAEGGLTDDEINLASLQGFKPVTLGKRILRTETAALAAIAAMQTLWGDF